MNYNIIFNKKCNLDFDIEIVKRPFIPVPNKKYKALDITGTDGTYYMDQREYEDIVINIEFNFVENDLDNIRSRIIKINKWLNNIKDNKLLFSDNPDMCYKVNKLEIENFNYEIMCEIQKFNINFTCKPHQYLIKGQKEIKVNGVLFNHWDITKPVYQLVGNGNCMLNVNGTVVNCTVNNTLIIDTEYDKILNYNKTLAVGKTDIKAMQDLYLKEGKNNITTTNGFELYIKPNYRTI